MRQLLTSRFFIAVAVFGALSLLAGSKHFWQAAPEAFPYRSWTAWAIDDFLHLKQAPDVVFMGSSLVLVPVSGVDADYLQKRLDGTEHHNSVYFEQKFASKTGLTTHTFNFALPGEMPSDAYLIADFLLKKHTPKVLVYGVGPRDFLDNVLPSPASTDPYRFLSRFGDVSPWASLMMPDWQERFSYELGRAIYLYGHKEDIVDRAIAWSSGELNQFVPAPPNASSVSREQLHQLLPDYRPFELQRGEAFFRPMTKDDYAKFTDNLDEYKKRYRKLKWDTFLTQMRFFTQTLASARQQGTKIVVVAMPITDLNRQLLSDMSWNTYRDSIKVIAKREGATFVDFNTDNDFKRSDFGDTVHLHAGGGKRWLDKLVDKLAADEQITASLRQPAQPGDVALTGKGGAL